MQQLIWYLHGSARIGTPSKKKGKGWEISSFLAKNGVKMTMNPSKCLACPA
jgi:hypothetical protein